AWYDNSAGNPANPDATRTVRWGPQTYDEMQLGYVEYYVPGVVPGTGSDKPGLGRQRLGRNGQGLAIETIFHRLDRDQDGQLKGDESPEGQRSKLLRLDTNGDGAISLPEARRLQR
ncbi:MAG: redoxin, partial [Planctomycetaceae bacterium]